MGIASCECPRQELPDPKDKDQNKNRLQAPVYGEVHRPQIESEGIQQPSQEHNQDVHHQ